VTATDATLRATDRYTIISADGHAGAEKYEYKEYLPKRYHEEFDRWAAAYSNPFGDLKDPKQASRNWDSDLRLQELDGDGIVAEILFPNTVPPFFPTASLIAMPPSAEEYELRWAGLQAHNRWLVDFCSRAPGRRAGVAQILLNEVEDAVREIKWVKESGLLGGILLPGVPPGSTVEPYHDPEYEPIWATCADYGVPINSHGGTAGPEPPRAGKHPASGAVFMIETSWFSHRTLWQLIFSGVLERHPSLTLVLTEQGSGWVPHTLDMLDDFHRRFTATTGNMESLFAGEAARALSLTPREYFERNVYLGSSFMRPQECQIRHEIGVHKMMWGADYPHYEGTTPYSRLALRYTFAGVDPAEVRTMLGTTAARVYGFDLAHLDTLAVDIGPTVEDVFTPLPDHDIPRHTSTVWSEKVPRRPF
jgi:predicted TIM-barrel fold metal-dependent hydrolase